MNILLTNDDGIHAEALLTLFKRFTLNHNVIIVAPDRERSAASHAITLHKPIRAKKIELKDNISGFAVSGTPADCVKIGISKLSTKKIDLVISGINIGANVGFDLNYSGTVAAAKEAALHKIPAIAVSLRGNRISQYNEITQFIEKLSQKIFLEKLPPMTFLNVNIPDIPTEKVKGIKICRQGFSPLSDVFHKRSDPRERDYYWQGYEYQFFEDDIDIDAQALSKDYISITPIKCDMTDHSIINDLKNWKF